MEYSHRNNGVLHDITGNAPKLGDDNRTEMILMFEKG